MKIEHGKHPGILLMCMIVLSLAYPNGLNATHIIGGEISYKCLGEEKFEITMYIYRDCNPGTHGFDRSAPVLAFDVHNERVWDVGVLGRFRIPILSVDSVHIELDDPCHIPPPIVCMEIGFYRDTIHLPFLEGGYQLVYQRCCRNGSIDNILNPQSAGAAYFTHITQKAFEECSEGIQFKNLNPAVVCKDEPIDFDNSVVGDTGDSVVYSLCAPLTEGFEDGPTPPFQTVIWAADSFGLDNMLGGEYPLEIDSRTGRLTGTPTIEGQFVVGICANVYKDGEIYNQIQRDFQYNIGICDSTHAEFSFFERYCGQEEISFVNESDFFLDQKWILGDPEDPLFESEEFEAEIEFPGLGEYDLTLIAYGNLAECNDTFTRTIEIVDVDFDIGIEVEYGPCSTRMELDFISQVQSDFPGSNDFRWTGRWNDHTTLNFDSIFSVNIFNSTSVLMDLAVSNQEADCWKTTSVEVPTGLVPDDGLKLSHLICKGRELSLNPDYYELSTYEWSPEEGLLDPPDFPNPRAMPPESIIYTAAISNGPCTGELVAEVEVFDQTIREQADTVCRFREITFTSPWGDESEDVQWYFYHNTALLGSRRGLEVSHPFQTAGQWTVEVIARHEVNFDCRDTVFIPVYVIDPEVSVDVAVGSGNCVDPFEVKLTADLEGYPFFPDHFLWIHEGDTAFTDSATYYFEVSGAEPVWIELFIPNEYSCDLGKIVLIEIELEDEYFVFDTLSLCRPDTIQLETGISEDFDFKWEPTPYFISEPDVSTPVVYPQSSTEFKATITHANCTVHYEMMLELGEHDVELNPIIYCDTLGVAAEVGYDSRLVYKWTVGPPGNPLDTARGHSVEFYLPDYGQYPVQLVLWDSVKSCYDTLRNVLELFSSSDFELEIATEILDCSGPVQLRIDADFTDDVPFELQFEWKVSGDTQFMATGDELLFLVDELPELLIELRLTNDYGCDLTLEKTYSPGLVIENTGIDSLTICEGDTAFLNTEYFVDFDYVWSPASGIIDPLTNPNPRASPAESILYTVAISDGDCTLERDVWVLVNPVPDIRSISADPNPIVRYEQSSNLRVDFSPAEAEVEWWPSESLDNPLVYNPIASPDSTTEYNVEVISAEGCTSRAEILVEVTDLPCARPFVFLPNAFSPNGDGQNDILYLRGEHVAQMELMIYNKMGQKVFHSRNQDVGWDGTFRGEDVQAGVYGYYLKASCVDGAKFAEQGSIMLLR